MRMKALDMSYTGIIIITNRKCPELWIQRMYVCMFKLYRGYDSMQRGSGIESVCDRERGAGMQIGIDRKVAYLPRINATTNVDVVYDQLDTLHIRAYVCTYVLLAPC